MSKERLGVLRLPAVNVDTFTFHQNSARTVRFISKPIMDTATFLIRVTNNFVTFLGLALFSVGLVSLISVVPFPNSFRNSCAIHATPHQRGLKIPYLRVCRTALHGALSPGLGARRLQLPELQVWLLLRRIPLSIDRMTSSEI